MRFLLDENVHRGLFSFLVKLGHNVKLSPKGIRNGEVFGSAIKEERFLITRDADFLDSSLYPVSKLIGVILLRVPPGDLEAQKRAISKLLEEQASEIEGRTIVLFSDKKFEFVE